MTELLFGLLGVILLYALGKVMLPDDSHIPIQQELIKMGDENHE